MIVGQDLADPVAFHDIHRYAINEAILLVRASFVERKPSLEGGMGLRDHIDLRRFQNPPNKLASQPPRPLAESCDASEEFRQDFLSSNEPGIPQVHRRGRVSPRIVGKKDRDPVKRIGEDNLQRFVDP